MKSILSFLFLFFFSASMLTAQFVNFEDTWQEFLSKEKVSAISKLPKPSKDDKIDYAKYCLMYATTDFCGSNIRAAETYMSEINKVGKAIYEKIPGFIPKHDDLDAKIKVAQQVNFLWVDFTENYNISTQQLEKYALAKKVCDKATLAKYFQMAAYAAYCEGDLGTTKDNFENRVLKLAERTSLKVDDVAGLKHEVSQMKALFGGLEALSPAWKKFVTTRESTGFSKELPAFSCNPTPNIMALILNGAADICGAAENSLQEIKRLSNESGMQPSAELSKEIKWLTAKVEEDKQRVALLDADWETFITTGKLSDGIQFGYDYCDKEDEIRAYTLTGILNLCEEGKEMLERVIAIQKEAQIDVAENTLNGIKLLGALLEKNQQTDDQVSTAWDTFMANGDTLTTIPTFSNSYCNNMDLIKSWIILGHLDACGEGDQFLDKIETLQSEAGLTFEEEIDCRVERLRTKIWDCRYWEIVAQARKETNEERERFGPKSAEVMRKDLNSSQQPCETTVAYEPLGYIGIKYIITTFLCQDVDLAKMGDPEYYKKIATWVDTEVLQAYCEESLRCKEDFFIYLEGHTDGNAFRGARYKTSLDIPKGTEFTHFEDQEVNELLTEREITTVLKSNMELGLARAWTVKNQLDFMEVPIKLGAYEHPSDEKGGEYRRIEIELNITNLMLDFYEKRLKELLDASKIGERPLLCAY